MAVAQLNVRIDAQTKREGDAALARFGVSATEVIRSLWQYLARAGELPTFMQEVKDEPAPAGPVAFDAAAEGAGMALSMARERGLASTLESLSYDELRDLAFDELVSEGSYRV